MNTFEFIRSSKNEVRVRLMFDKMVFDTSLVDNRSDNSKIGICYLFIQKYFREITHCKSKYEQTFCCIYTLTNVLLLYCKLRQEELQKNKKKLLAYYCFTSIWWIFPHLICVQSVQFWKLQKQKVWKMKRSICDPYIQAKLLFDK